LSPKLYISTDLEGVHSLVIERQFGSDPNDPMYQEARKYLTDEVNAVVRGAKRAGVSTIIVNDGHGANFSVNIIPDLIEDPDILLIQGSPKSEYLPLLEECEYLISIGCHGMAGSKAVFDHTMSSKTWVKMIVNNLEAGEVTLQMVYAGDLDIPTLMISGDEAACQEARRNVPNIITAPVKRALSRSSAVCLTPAKALKLIELKTYEALVNRDKIKPFKLKSPYEIMIQKLHVSSFKLYSPPPNVEKIDERTVLIRGDNMKEVMKSFLDVI